MPTGPGGQSGPGREGCGVLAVGRWLWGAGCGCCRELPRARTGWPRPWRLPGDADQGLLGLQRASALRKADLQSGEMRPPVRPWRLASGWDLRAGVMPGCGPRLKAAVTRLGAASSGRPRAPPLRLTFKVRRYRGHPDHLASFCKTQLFICFVWAFYFGTGDESRGAAPSSHVSSPF